MQSCTECGADLLNEYIYVQNGIRLSYCHECGLIQHSEMYNEKGFRNSNHHINHTNKKKHSIILERFENDKWTPVRVYKSKKQAKGILKHIQINHSPLRLVDDHNRIIATL